MLKNIVHKNELLQKFEKFLLNYDLNSDSFHPHFMSAYKEMLYAGGKRFRPLLLLSIVEALNPLLLNNAMHAALAIEMMHTYSLIHDDLPSMDNSSLRRGHPTLHITYNEVTAILIGDALNSDAFHVLCKMPLDSSKIVKLCKILSINSGCQGMVLGQAIDCYFENKTLNLDELSFLHLHKTGKLIASSLQMGAVICGESEKVQQDIYEFGLNLGLVFQINDDILDATSSEINIGKPTNNDKNKNTYTNLLGLECAIEKKNEEILKLKNTLLKFDKKIQNRLLEILKNSFK